MHHFFLHPSSLFFSEGIVGQQNRSQTRLSSVSLRIAQIATAFHRVSTASPGNRELQATTKGNKATRIISIAIQVYPRSLRVVRVVGNAKNPKSANEQKSGPELGHEPELLHPKQRFLRQALGLGLALITRRQSP